MIDDAVPPHALTHRDARRRVRLGVAVYALCLVALLLAGSYLAPAAAIDAPNGTVDVAGSNLHAR
jgi:hypothetical protein